MCPESRLDSPFRFSYTTCHSSVFSSCGRGEQGRSTTPEQVSTMASARIHPTAIVSPEAELAEDVQVGPYVVIEGPVRRGPGCVLKPQVHLVGPMTMGSRNVVFTGCIIGEQPQHLRYSGEPTGTEI